MTDEAIRDGCFDKIENAIIMLEKSVADLKLIKNKIGKRELPLSAAMTTVCSVLTNAMCEISISDILKLAALASQLDGWGS